MNRQMLTPALALLGAATLAACGGAAGREDYVKDGDTGAAAPAAVQTVNQPTAPDSTAGISRRTGARGITGDTTVDGVQKGTISTNDNTQAVPGAATGTTPQSP